MIKSEVRILDMGYYGNSHEKVGIVIGVKSHVLTVINITDPTNRYEETIHRESFTPGNDNLSDIVSSYKYNSSKEVAKNTGGAKFEVRKAQTKIDLNVDLRKKYIDLVRTYLYKAKQVYIYGENEVIRKNNLETLISDIWTGELFAANDEFEKLFIGGVDYWSKFVKFSSFGTLGYKRVWTICITYNNGIYTLQQLGNKYETVINKHAIT